MLNRSAICYRLLISIVVAVVQIPLVYAEEFGQSVTLDANEREKIREVISEYSYALDSGNLQTWLALLTEDAWFETPVGNPRGSKQLTDWFNERIASRPPNVQVRHFALNIVITPVSRTHARAKSMLLYTRENINEPGSAKVVATGIYEDEFRLTRQGWRLASHRMAPALF